MNKSLLIKDALFKGESRNILIEGNRFSTFDAPADLNADEVLDAKGASILPALYNTHTHAAMSLLRGYADDMPLQKWLTEYIWPYEDKLTPDDIEYGSQLAVREMISTGSVFFNDMYFEVDRTVDVVAKAGIRAAIGLTFMDYHSKAMQDSKIEMLRHWQDPTGGRISLVVAPHAIYTVGPEKLRFCAELAAEQGCKLHIHLSETKTEVDDCIRDHGMTPVRYLDSLGVLGPNVLAAHCVWVDRAEWDILAERGVTVSHCPCSNMKLGSGRFPYEDAIASGCRITLGTDGCSSNNNLDLREEMKFAALLAKSTGDPSLLPAEQVLSWATQNGASAFGIDAGALEAGKLADCILVNCEGPKMTPCHNLVSNWVYAADSSCIDHVLCDGKVLK